MQNDQPVHEIIIDKKIRGTMRKIGAEQVRKVAYKHNTGQQNTSTERRN